MNRIIFTGIIFAVLSVIFVFTDIYLLYLTSVIISIICLIIDFYINREKKNGE